MTASTNSEDKEEDEEDGDNRFGHSKY